MNQKYKKQQLGFIAKLLFLFGKEIINYTLSQTGRIGQMLGRTRLASKAGLSWSAESSKRKF